MVAAEVGDLKQTEAHAPEEPNLAAEKPEVWFHLFPSFLKLNVFWLSGTRTCHRAHRIKSKGFANIDNRFWVNERKAQRGHMKSQLRQKRRLAEVITKQRYKPTIFTNYESIKLTSTDGDETRTRESWTGEQAHRQRFLRSL